MRKTFKVPHRTIAEMEDEILRLKVDRMELSRRISHLGRAIRRRVATARLTDEQRFWSWVDKSPHYRGCWIWTGFGSPTPTVWWQGKTRSARWVSWHLNGHKAGLEPGQRLEVKCGTGMCVKPSHLVPGRIRKAYPGDDEQETFSRVGRWEPSA